MKKIKVVLVRKRKKSEAIKVDHTGASVPKPTKELLLEMAVGIHLSVAGTAAVDRNETEDAFPEWEALPDNVKDYWLEGARCAYAIVAIHGGGSVSKLE